MKKFFVVFLGALLAVFMAACASTATYSARPNVQQPSSTPSAYSTRSESETVQEYAPEDEGLPTEEYVPQNTSLLRPADVAPETCVWPSAEETNSLRRANPDKNIVNHMACPENPGRRPAAGEYLAVTKVLMPAGTGWKCRNSAAGFSSVGRNGKPMYLPPGAGVWMKVGPDGRPDPTQQGWQCGCGNTTTFADKNPNDYEWYRTEEPRYRKNGRRPRGQAPIDLDVQTQPPPRRSTRGVQFAGTVRNASGGTASPACRYIYGYWPIGSRQSIAINDLTLSAGEQRVPDVDGTPVPFPKDAYTDTLPFNSEVAYLAQCRIGSSVWNGQIQVVDLPEPGFCESHSGLCSFGKWFGGIALGGLIGYEINRQLINPPHHQQTPPCYGQCTSDPTFPKQPWPGTNPSQPNPGPTWPGDPNPAPPGPGTSPPANPGPTWPGNTPPPTSPPPSGPGTPWPGH